MSTEVGNHSISTFAVGTDADAKSGFINTRELLRHREHGLPVVSMETPAALEAGSVKILWYGSSTGEADSELPIKDESGTQAATTIAVDTAIELNVQRFIRWPHLMVQIADSGGTAVPQSAERTFTLLANCI